MALTFTNVVATAYHLRYRVNNVTGFSETDSIAITQMLTDVVTGALKQFLENVGPVVDQAAARVALLESPNFKATFGPLLAPAAGSAWRLDAQEVANVAALEVLMGSNGDAYLDAVFIHSYVR